jgi:putative glutamine amidotransferase
MKPLVGISRCTKQFGVFGMPNHAASDTYVRASDLVVGGVPVLMPANGPTADIETLLDRLDGIILTGSRSNVQPALYDDPPHAEGTHEDPNRYGITLPLIRAAVARSAGPDRPLNTDATLGEDAPGEVAHHPDHPERMAA